MGKRINISVPTDLTDISVSKLIKLLNINTENDAEKIDLTVAYACEIDLKLVKAMPLKNRLEIATKIGQALNKPVPQMVSFRDYELISDWYNITFGEFVSMDETITPQHPDDIKTVDDAGYFMAVCYREKGAKFTGLESPEPFKEATSNFYLYAVKKFFELKNYVVESHTNVYVKRGDSENVDEVQSFGWFGVIDALAGHDITKHDAVTSLPLMHVMRKLDFDAQVKQQENLKRLNNGLRAI